MEETNYFVCTLGQAARLKQVKSHKTIPEFLDQQAAENPGLPAFGFYEASSGSRSLPECHIHTFGQLQKGVRKMAFLLQSAKNLNKGQKTALLCSSTAVFLYSWLALIYLGHPVLLIAPQCSASAINHLCRVCDVKVLFYDRRYAGLVQESCNDTFNGKSHALRLKELPFKADMDLLSLFKDETAQSVTRAPSHEEDVAYLHHTSGTSTGLPSPIPQTHRGGFGVLPRLDGTKAATFTTTPLYHGGVADLFRAWTSDALIWIFPGKDLPITASNILNCLKASKSIRNSRGVPAIRYFSSVPYVLQSMADDDDGLDQLRNLDIVGVGGAALPPEIGDRLVSANVNLVSRFGSAECGFLMSSHRNYSHDHDWQYLRICEHETKLSFKEHSDGLFELIVRPDWPHMAKHNQHDGSYATSDLFEPHPCRQNAWRYHSRADSQLTLITGKKFDSAPLEATLSASCSQIQDVLIFGEGMPYPGVLLFRSRDAEALSDQNLVDTIWPSVVKLNHGGQSHVHLSEDMLIPMPYSSEPLEKSSKGTVMRRQAFNKFANVIAAAYEKPQSDSGSAVPDDGLQAAIFEDINSLLSARTDSSEKLTANSDLFTSGVDSVASIRIRQSLSKYLPASQQKLPPTLVEDCGTIARLAKALISLRHGKTLSKKEDVIQQMQDMLKQHLDFSVAETPVGARNGVGSTGKLKVLMTGPTGFLGSHLLHQLLHDAGVGHVYLLVRGASQPAARERVIKALRSRRLLLPTDFDASVTVLPCKFSAQHLGLSAAQYQDLADRIDVIAHLAWAVNFMLPLRGFTSHLAALQNLLSLALSSSKPVPPRFLFCSTVAAVSQHPHPIPEALIADPLAANATGYGRSKWIAEQICLSASRSSRLQNRISIVRVGQLSGASDTGVWASSEAYPLIMSTFQHVGCVPDLDFARASQRPDGKGTEVLNWLPVDVAGRAFAELVTSRQHAVSSNSSSKGEGIPVYHLLSAPSLKSRSWSDFVSIVSRHETESVPLVPVDKWLDRVEAMREAESTRDHPAMSLVPFWREAYCKIGSENNSHARDEPGVAGKDNDEESTVSGGFQMQRTMQTIPDLAQGSGLDEEYIMKLWNWVQETSKTRDVGGVNKQRASKGAYLS